MNREQRRIYQQVISLKARGNGERILTEFSGKYIGATVRNLYELGFQEKEPMQGQSSSPAMGAYYAGKDERLAVIRKQFTGV